MLVRPAVVLPHGKQNMHGMQSNSELKKDDQPMSQILSVTQTDYNEHSEDTVKTQFSQ